MARIPQLDVQPSVHVVFDVFKPPAAVQTCVGEPNAYALSNARDYRRVCFDGLREETGFAVVLNPVG